MTRKQKLEHTGFRGLKAIMVSFLMGSGWKGIVAKHIPAVLGRQDAQGNLAPTAPGGENRACH